MQKEEAYFLHLLSGYIDNTLSKEQVKDLFDLIAEDQAYSLHLLDSPEIKEKLETLAVEGRQGIPDLLSKRMHERLLSAIEISEIQRVNAHEHSDDLSNPVSRRVTLRMSWVRYAAASVLAILFGSYFFFVNKTEQRRATPLAQNSSKNDVLPGSNKAVLTLNNGAKIMLDNAHTGILAEQGNAKISETENGKLAYNASTEKPAELSYNTLSTPRGGQHQLILADGTKVWLNAASSITYPTTFTGKERKVMITGEVYFEVVHNASKPFRVEVNGSRIEDVGTHFNINAYSDEPAIRTTLIEGAVKINNQLSSVFLKPGQQALLGANEKIRILSNVNTENIIAWKDGKFHYEGEDIQTIMRQIARWYDVEVVYKGTISETFSGGISRQANVSELLKILEYSNKVKFEIEGKSIIVEPK